MYSTDFCRLRLASEKEEIILKYIKERRYTFMLGFYISLAVSVLGFVPALLDLRMAMNGGTLLSLPEMDVPMLAAGIKPKKTFVYALLTGVVEVLGTLIGFFAVSLSEAILPFALAFAGGTMLYVISDEMIPETHAHGHERGATYALLVGFCVMLVTDVLLG